MDLPSLQALVTRSALLTDDERKYWLSMLPTLVPQHIQKLEAILAEAETIPLKESVHEYFQAIAK